MNLAAVQDAIFDWTKAASGFADGLILWRDQDDPSPVSDFIVLHLTGPFVLGQDSQSEAYDALGPPGGEVLLGVEGDREVGLRVEFFTSATASGTDAMARAGSFVTACQLPTKREILRAAGLSLFDLGRVEYAPSVQEAGFQGRAFVDMRLYLRDVAQERIGLIESAELTNLTTGETFTAP